MHFSTSVLSAILALAAAQSVHGLVVPSRDTGIGWSQPAHWSRTDELVQNRGGIPWKREDDDIYKRTEEQVQNRGGIPWKREDDDIYKRTEEQVQNRGGIPW